MIRKLKRYIFALGEKISEYKYQKEMAKYRKLYSDFTEETAYDNGKIKFIWGRKSADDLCQEDACLYTMNDIDITYSRKDKRYMLGIETAYWFENKVDEVKYLERLLYEFTLYMQLNQLAIDEPYRFWMAQPQTLLIAESIPELYTNFKIFVEGYKALYTSERK